MTENANEDILALGAWRPEIHAALVDTITRFGVISPDYDPERPPLAIIDCETWKTLETIYLPDAKRIHDIRILDRPDLCHHGAIFRRPLEPRQSANAETMGSYVLDEAHRSLPHMRAATSNHS